MGFLSGKRALIVGVASDRSIAWGIAQAMHREGAELAFSYVNEKFKERVQPLAESLGSKLTMQLDVTNDAEIDSAFAAIKQAWGSLDIVVHAVAYAPREALAGGFVESTSREAFKVAHDVSSYSLTALARVAKPLMAGRAGAILTLSYLGAVKSIPSYNVMGLAKASLEANVRFLAADMGPNNVRVNGISAGPIKTLAAAGIAGFLREAHPHRVESPVDVENLASDSVSEIRAQERGGIAHVFERDIAAQRRDVSDPTQHLAEAGDSGGGQSLDGARRDSVHAHIVRTHVGRQEAHVGFEARLGQAHDVVARDGFDGTEVGERDDGARTARHERLCSARQRGQAVARNIVGDFESLARRGLDETAGQRFPRRVGDRVDHNVERSPGLFDGGEGGVDFGVIGDVELHGEL